MKKLAKTISTIAKLAQPAETEKQLTLELEPVTEPLVAEEPVNFLRTMKQLSGKTYLRRSRSYFQSFKMAYLSLYGRNTGELATLESQRWVAAQQFSDYVFQNHSKMVELFKRTRKK